MAMAADGEVGESWEELEDSGVSTLFDEKYSKEIIIATQKELIDVVVVQL